MVALDQLVASIIGLSSNGDLQQLATTLKKEADAACQASPGAILAAVATLNAQQHSLGIVYLL